MSPTPGERLGTLEQRLTDHEGRCEERLAEIKKIAAGTESAVRGLQNRSWAIVIAILAWALSQIWVAQKAQIERIETRGAAASR